MRIFFPEPMDFAPDALDKLRGAGHAICRHEAGNTDFDAELAEAEVVVVRLGIHWDAKRLSAAPKLRAILTPTTGLDHIDLEAAAEAGVAVLSLRGLEGLDTVTSTPEHAFALLLSLVRHIPAASAAVLRGEWNRDAFVGRELRGKRAGIIGCGRTGSAFGGYCEAFGMHVEYIDPNVEHPAWRRHGGLADLARSCEVISLHVHLDDETQNMLDASFFGACAHAPWLINTSRGALIDESALMEALDGGQISGFAGDVICNEPETGDALLSPLLDVARRRDNVILTPHIAGATIDAMRTTENMIVDAFLKWMSVDPDKSSPE